MSIPRTIPSPMAIGHFMGAVAMSDATTPTAIAVGTDGPASPSARAMSSPDVAPMNIAGKKGPPLNPEPSETAYAMALNTMIAMIVETEVRDGRSPMNSSPEVTM